MRLSSLAAVLLLGTLVLAPALADEPEKKPEPAEQKKEPTLPWSPFALANEGDWSVYVVTAKASSRKDPVTLAMRYRVTSVASDSVVITHTSRSKAGFESKPGDESFSTKKDPTVRDFVSAKTEREQFFDVKVEEEKKTVSGKEFACAKLSYSSKAILGQGDPGDRVWTAKVVTWISKEAKCQGIVAMTIESRTTQNDKLVSEGKTEYEIVGFGTLAKTEWGKKFEDVVLPDAPRTDETPGSPEKK